jgi:hypothetical protein
LTHQKSKFTSRFKSKYLYWEKEEEEEYCFGKLIVKNKRYTRDNLSSDSYGKKRKMDQLKM